MLLVAVTGGIGSGKSTVSAGLAGRDALLIDADRVARGIMEPGGRAYGGVVERFGPGVVSPDGQINRPALAAIVFHDRDALYDLNRLTHPLIADEILTKVASLGDHDGPVILDIPLLDGPKIEQYKPDALIVVDTPEDVAVERLVAHRGFTVTDARARVAAQMSDEERRDLVVLVPAGLVISNAGDRAALEAEIDRAWTWIGTLGRSA